MLDQVHAGAAPSRTAALLLTGEASLARYDELIRLCAAGGAEGAAAIAFDTFRSLPTTEALPEVCAD